MKIHPVGAEMFHANGRTDMTKLIAIFRNFANAPKNWIEKLNANHSPTASLNKADKSHYSVRQSSV